MINNQCFNLKSLSQTEWNFNHQFCSILAYLHFRPLGDLRFLRLWHDNRGKGDDASWYCDFVRIIDLQTKTRYNFIVGKWFAVEEDDGLVGSIRHL